MPIPKLLQDANHHEIQAGKIGQQLAPVAIGGAAADTGVIDPDKDSLVRIITTKDAYCDIGVAAAATNQQMILPAGSIEYFVVPAGAVVSFLELAAGAGDARVTVMG